MQSLNEINDNTFHNLLGKLINKILKETFNFSNFFKKIVEPKSYQMYVEGIPSKDYVKFVRKLTAIPFSYNYNNESADTNVYGKYIFSKIFDKFDSNIKKIFFSQLNNLWLDFLTKENDKCSIYYLNNDKLNYILGTIVNAKKENFKVAVKTYTEEICEGSILNIEEKKFLRFENGNYTTEFLNILESEMSDNINCFNKKIKDLICYKMI
jgi:hypothetical protein